MDRTITRPATPDAELTLKQDIVRRSPFAVLTGASRSAVLDLGRLDRFPRHHRLTEQGEAPQSLFLLGSGRVKVERVTGERVFPLGHRGPGQLVGEGACANASTSMESASVVDDIEAVALPIEGFLQLIAVDPQVRLAVTAALAQQFRATEDRLASLLLQGVEARLVGFLLDAVQRWGKPHSGGETITASFTHADVALLIGSTRETVTLLLGKLKRSGLIAFDRRRVIIPDRDALATHGASA
jgi:CRP/FNR family cyclic AMP-dependent transcriptional regulator